MSQPRRTTLGSWGLIAGRRIVPPPPGPITVQASRRALRAGPSSAASAGTARDVTAASAAANWTLFIRLSVPSGLALGPVPRGALLEALRDLDRLTRLAQARRRRGAGLQRVEEGGRLPIESAQLEELGAVARAVAAQLLGEAPAGEVPKAARRVDAAP